MKQKLPANMSHLKKLKTNEIQEKFVVSKRCQTAKHIIREISYKPTHIKPKNV